MGTGEIGSPAVNNFESLREPAAIHQGGVALFGVAFNGPLDGCQAGWVGSFAVMAEGSGEVACVTGGSPSAAWLTGSGFGGTGLAISGSLTGVTAGFFFSSGERIVLGAGSVKDCIGGDWTGFVTSGSTALAVAGGGGAGRGSGESRTSRQRRGWPPPRQRRPTTDAGAFQEAAALTE